MRLTKTLEMIEAHAEGEIGRIVTNGDFHVPGDSMLSKMNYINHQDDSLRRFLVFEPRGFAQMSTNLLFPPTRPDADVAFIILQGDKAHAMSGSNAICLTTVVLETGIIEMKEPETVLHIDTPAGLVKATARCKDGKCERVSLDMNPSFASDLDVKIDVDGIGQVVIDIAFGGVFYGLIDVAQFNIDISPNNARQLVEIGTKVHQTINRDLHIKHPEIDGLEGLSYTMFTGFNADGEMQGATILPPGRIDRSPCGTGNSARLAVMHARGEVDVGEKRIARSIINSCFDVEITGKESIGATSAILPRISGRGWIFGKHEIGIDPQDPYPMGYSVSDCWGDGLDLLNSTD